MFLGLTTAQQKAVEQYYPQGAGFLHGLDVSVEKAEKGISVQIEKQRAVIRLENANSLAGHCFCWKTPFRLGVK